MNEFRIDWAVLLVAMAAGFAAMREQREWHLKTLPFYLLFTLIIELISRYYRIRSVNNLPLLNIYSVLQLTYFTWCFYLMLKKKFIRIFIVLIPTICFLNIFFVQGVYTFHTYSYVLCVLFIIFFSAYFYYRIFKESIVESLIKEPGFWFVTGVLLFYTTTVSIIGILNYIAVLPPEMILLMRKTLLNVNSLFYFILIITFLCKLNIQRYIRNS